MMPFADPPLHTGSLSSTEDIGDIDRPVLATQPTYPDGVLRGLDDKDLVEIMVRDCDGVPIEVIEECARRGGAMEALLAPLFRGPPGLEESQGQWWLRLHAINILGLLSSASAAEVLTHAMLWLSEFEEDDLQDWCGGYWPAWFRNKPDSVMADLQKITADRNISIGTRLDALECVLAAACRQGPQSLDSQLDALAELAVDTREPAEFRFLAGALLLDFPRARHRKLLEQLADEQARGSNYFPAAFSAAQVSAHYDAMHDSLPWLQFDDPLGFYRTEEFESRQLLNEGLFDEDLLDNALSFDAAAFDDYVPYVRDTPKIGRNDPCYCGSGKKYKKCCLREGSR